MKKDSVIIVAMALFCGALAAFFWLQDAGDSAGDVRIDPAGSPFSRTEESNVVRRHLVKPAKENRESEAVVVEVAPEFAAVETLDVFGRPAAELVVDVVDLESQPLAGAKVKLFHFHQSTAFGSQRGTLVTESQTDGQGRVRLTSLESGLPYSLLVMSIGVRRFRWQPFELDSGAVNYRKVVLGPGVPLRGRVTDAADASPLANALISVYDLTDASIDEEAIVEAQERSDEKGYYRFDSLVSGPKRVTAFVDGYAGKTQPHVAMGTQEMVVDFGLSEGDSISGFVFDNKGQPIPHALVKVRPVHGKANSDPQAWYPAVRCNAKGAFDMHGLHDGMYFLRAEKIGFAEGNFGVAVPGDPDSKRASMKNASAGDVDVSLYLAQAPTIAGVVITAVDGQAVAAFDLYADARKNPARLDPMQKLRVVNSEGQFLYGIKVLGIQMRRLWLHARAPGFAGGRVLVDFAGDRAPGSPLLRHVAGIKIVMEAGAQIAGRILDLEGQALSDCQVRARFLRDQQEVPNPTVLGNRFASRFGSTTTVRSNAKGDFLLDALAAGKYVVEAEHPDFALSRFPDEIVVQSQGRFDAGTLRLAAGGRVEGVVWKNDEEPEEGAVVLLEAQDRVYGRDYRFRTTLSGAYRFPNVAAGEYRLLISERGGFSTRSALYQATKKKTPQLHSLRITEGVVIRKDLKD